MKKRVVITGMGMISPIGNSVNEAFQNAINGVSGIKIIDSFNTDELKVKIAAPVENFDPSPILSKREIRRQDLFSQFAVVGAHQAFEDSKLEGNIDPKRLGVILGTGMGGMQTYANDLNKAFDGGLKKIPPMFIPMIIPNMASGNVAIAFNAQAHTTTITTACAAATHAIGDAYRLIQHDYADAMITGGTEAAVNPYTLAGFSALTALSTNPDPSKASRPFDKHRDGFVLGEGAGILVIESLDHALNRKAHIYAEIIGYGSSSDAYHITAPNGIGAQDAMKLALDDANLKPEDVDYINAHGTSTPINDKFETDAIKQVFKDHAYHLAISSTKSMHGHALGATGGIEAILSVKTITEGVIPPTINQETSDEECDLNYTPNVAQKKNIDVAMSTSLGFGGHNAVLIFRKYGEKHDS
ncbi:beta-ketoacyl-ACP synthase II [Erysipelothrix urinaevulpis]|uniref:beta-ketoacyl-ACP synthase II n=1 Tax=Erysipelothrix urinaevulpis TaxID=2683717 RepID=UPI001F308B47|nr:beta-ketoacyl-ACP synthase II [Erysipelothrix urinaevulpis]